MKKKKLIQLFPKKVIQIGTADPKLREGTVPREEAVWDDLKKNGTEEKQADEEYEVVEREILPAQIICPDCGGITLEGLDFCDKCGGELNQDSKLG